MKAAQTAELRPINQRANQRERPLKERKGRDPNLLQRTQQRHLGARFIMKLIILYHIRSNSLLKRQYYLFLKL